MPDAQGWVKTLGRHSQALRLGMQTLHESYSYGCDGDVMMTPGKPEGNETQRAFWSVSSQLQHAPQTPEDLNAPKKDAFKMKEGTLLLWGRFLNLKTSQNSSVGL